MDGDRLIDAPLQRAIRLGERDRQLIVALQQPRTLQELFEIVGEDARPRLTALARLYLLAGPRANARLALQAERRAFAPSMEAPLRWPEGRAPPQHGCVGTGTCCSASFLGPVYDADARRVSALAFGRQRALGPGDALFETVAFRGKEVRGMARDPEGRCVAQGDDGLCEIHLAHGAAAKPVTCRQFPLRFHQSPDGVHVSLLLACDGYDRARPAAVAWQEREAEIRGLLAEGAAAVPVALPVTWSAGLPVAWRDWQALRSQFLAAEPAAPDALAWLQQVLVLAEAALRTRAQALAEGSDVAWSDDLPRWRAGLAAPGALWSMSQLHDARGQLLARAAAPAAQLAPRDRDRLRALAHGLDALATSLPLSAVAAQHLNDIVSNDLQVQVVLGELDAGLASLVRRVLIARAVATAHARAAGRSEIDALDTTYALHVVYRSEPELTWLGQLDDPSVQVAPASPVP